jgi:hypothetical protein
MHGNDDVRKRLKLVEKLTAQINVAEEGTDDQAATTTAADLHADAKATWEHEKRHLQGELQEATRSKTYAGHAGVAAWTTATQEEDPRGTASQTVTTGTAGAAPGDMAVIPVGDDPHWQPLITQKSGDHVNLVVSIPVSGVPHQP